MNRIESSSSFFMNIGSVFAIESKCVKENDIKKVIKTN